MTTRVEKVSYAGWANCYRLTDGVVECIATADVGPRVIRLGYVNEKNLLGEKKEDLGRNGDSEWVMYGGHRLWHSPESRSRTYNPDNFPVTVEEVLGGIRLIQAVEPNTGILKEIILTLQNGSFTVEHRMTNKGNWTVNLSLWPITVMSSGGTAILPQYRIKDAEGLLPNRVVALWPYTDMNDSRVAWGNRYLLIRQDHTKNNPFKIGISVPEGWIAYANDGYLFVKQTSFIPGDVYPDHGVNMEVYTNDWMLEVETLSPLTELTPGGTATHTEVWRVLKVDGSINTEGDVERLVIPLL